MSGPGSRHRGFLERSVDALRTAMERALAAEVHAGRRGWLQALDPRVKLAGILALVAAVAMARQLTVLAALLVLGLATALLSRLPMRALASGVSLAAVGFALALAVPALFLTPGTPVARLPVAGWPVTAQGLTSAAYLVLRTTATATFAFLLVFSTPWSHVLKALRSFRVPTVLVVVLGTTYRYILLLLDAAHDLFEARRSRAVGPLGGRERRRLVATGAGVLLSRSLQLSGEVYLAMQARGYRGEVHLLDDFSMTSADWLALATFGAVAAAAAWAGR